MEERMGEWTDGGSNGQVFRYSFRRVYNELVKDKQSA